VEAINGANLEIDNTAKTAATLTIPVTLPQNELVTVHVWTR
jgi:hypothetical protein